MNRWLGEYNNIKLEKNGSSCTLTLNRPKRRNAITEDLMLEMMDAIEKINAEEEIRVVIIKGAGRDFCAGFDFQYFEPDVSPEQVKRVVAIGPKFKNAIMNLRPITVASIGGNCVGGGVVIAFACDFRYASEDSRFWLPETQLGIPLAFGSIPMLSDGLSKAIAMEFVLLGGKLTAQELFEARLLNGVADETKRDERVAEVSKEIIAIPALVADYTKRQLLAARDSWSRTPYEFADASLLHAGLTDKECIEKRAELIRAMRMN